MIARLAILLVAFVAALPPLARAEGAGFPMAANLAPVRDWSSQQPFIDVMKTARRWIGHKPGQWGGVSFEELEAQGIFDAHGWPTRIPQGLGSVGTLVLTDLPADARVHAGRYVLRFEGEGIVEVSGAVRNTRYGKGRVSFDFVPGGMVNVKIQRTDPRGTGDHVRAITLMREDHEAAHQRGEIFNPLWLERMRGFAALRFMDWMVTNDSTQSAWADRPRIDDFSYTRRGVPVEVMIALANELGAAPWFTLPHLSDETYQRAFAAMVAERLEPGLKVYVEFSNEVWNWQFAQSVWAEEQARARWGRRYKGQDYYGMKTAQMAWTWSGVFAARRDRLVVVIASQAGWPGLESAILEAPLWVAEDPAANPAPHSLADAYAVTGYFGGYLGSDESRERVRRWLADSRAEAEATGREAGLSGAALDAHVREHRHDGATAAAVAALTRQPEGGEKHDTLAYVLGAMLPYHAAVARRYGLDFIVYEGGSHIVGVGAQVEDDGMTDFFTHLNYTPGMGALYDRLFAGWADLGGGLFAVFSDVMVPTKWGSWGHLRHLGDANPRWQAVERARGDVPR